MRQMGRAMQDFDMLREGDRILVGLSGGKDSLSLLHMLLTLSRRAPVRFSVAACTVDPSAAGYDPGPTLVPHLRALGVPYFLERQPIVEQARQFMDAKRPSICACCSRMKRGVLYSTARREGYNVLALGQHLDDLAESFVMSAFQNGVLRTMKAHYANDAGDLRVVRPLVYVRERELAAHAAAAGLPVVADNCPACFQEPKERARVKSVLANQEQLFPQLPRRLLAAMRPLMRGAMEPRAPRWVPPIAEARGSGGRAAAQCGGSDDEFDQNGGADAPGRGAHEAPAGGARGHARWCDGTCGGACAAAAASARRRRGAERLRSAAARKADAHHPDATAEAAEPLAGRGVSSEQPELAEPPCLPP